MTLIKRHGVQFIGAWTACMDQHIGALARRDQQLFSACMAASWMPS